MPTTDELHQLLAQLSGTVNVTEQRATDDRALLDWALATEANGDEDDA